MKQQFRTRAKRQQIRNLLGDRSITLVGIMGAGKTTLGREISNLIKLKHIDSDREIENCARLTINDLFALYGEGEFRKLERRVISRIFKEKNLVLSSGGGSFIHQPTIQIIKKHSITIWLVVDIEILLERLSRRDTRPLLRGKNQREVISQLLTLREPLYSKADLKIHCGNRNQFELAHHILHQLENYLQKNENSKSDY